jgi:hypothetical protein
LIPNPEFHWTFDANCNGWPLGKNGHIRRAPLVGAEAVCSIQVGSGADERRPPRKAAKRDSHEARTPC